MKRNLLIAAALVATVAACGGGDDNDADEIAETAVSSDVAATEDAATDDAATASASTDPADDSAVAEPSDTGTDDGTAEPTTDSESAGESDADEGADLPMDSFPLTVSHAHGETTVDTAPERVVTVGLRDQDAALAVGVIPVGVQDWFGGQPDAVWPWAQDELGDADPVVLDPTALDFETIASLEPDLILAVDAGLSPEEYELMSEIAPTVAQPAEHPSYAVPWRERTMRVAEAVGRSARGAAVVADVEQQIEDAAAAHPEFAEATALVGLAAMDGQAYAYGSDDVRSRLLVDLGFSIPDVIESQVEEDSFYVTLSQENFDQLDADVVVWVGGDAATFDAVVAEPLYPARVATEGRDLFLPYDPLGGAISFASALSLPFLVDELVPELVLALDGDPSTSSDFGR